MARLSVNGLITEDSKLNEAIAALADDASAKALIVAIDSPGGSVAGGETLHAAIAQGGGEQAGGGGDGRARGFGRLHDRGAGRRGFSPGRPR